MKRLWQLLLAFAHEVFTEHDWRCVGVDHFATHRRVTLECDCGAVAELLDASEPNEGHA